MFMHPDIARQLAHEHQREMLAEASRRRLQCEVRRQQRRPAPRLPGAARINRRLAAAIARARVVAAQVPGAIGSASGPPPGRDR